ncbi:hypothetical protein [Wolbachia endosymbiont of Ctenocephalides felis wCfeJ]|uniref:hypothetical protein n=1 Tax=Wolbachia endosymbiont of Ctenocephalides felis wCfeJ TaxID=2732594 RepID=UPI001444F36E|nr:hypothetical protein [Wolbachia endosymbiont of Ctenocephalides felis wCfeJ]WCR58211.1 MAG: hypothetical protein PG980_000683 [Wolbachia endosymbiont of Ctenocephalides felis wCfeJ]
MSKKTEKARHKLSKSDISSPIIPNPAPITSEVRPIKVRREAKTNNLISEKGRAHSLSTFSTDSDAVSISSDSGISSSFSTTSDSEVFDTNSISSDSGTPSGRITPTASVAEDIPQSKSANGRKPPVLGKLKKVSIPEVPKDFVLSKKKSPQMKSKPQQPQKAVEQIVSLDDQIKALQNRQNNLQQKLTKLNQQSRLFIFIKSKEHRTKERELNSQLAEVTKAKWKVELDRKFESDKDLEISDFADRSCDASNSNNKYLEGINKVIKKHPSLYVHYTCKDPNDFLNSRSFVYKSLQEILERANPTYEDKQILLRYDAYQVKTLLQSGDITDKEDKKALKEIYKDLKNEMSKSRKSFDAKNDQYICKLRKGRGTSPDSIMKSVQTSQQLQHSR